METADSTAPLGAPLGAALTRSSQASTSASTLESFLSSASALLSSAAASTTLPSSDRPPMLRSRTSKLAAIASSDTPTPTELTRANAYEQLHASTSSAAAAANGTRGMGSSASSSSVETTSNHTHPPAQHTNHAFLITYFVAGGAAGATSRTVVSPLERLKIIMQVQPQTTSSSSTISSPGTSSGKARLARSRAYNGVWGGLVKMWKEEGFAGFMRGNGINCLRIAPYSAVQFTTYEMAKTYLRDHSGNSESELDVVRKLTAGAIAGIASVVSTYPLDLVRSRISIASANMFNEAKSEVISHTTDSKMAIGTGKQVSQEALRFQIAERQKAVPGIWQMTTKVYREEGGLRGLYRGCVPTSVGVAPYVALNFYFYEAARKYISTSADGLQHDEPSSLAKLGCGALAGSISQTLTYPLDVLRRRMQVAGMKDSQEKLGYKDRNAINAIQNIVKAEGVTGLYRGLLPNLLKVAPSIGTSFLTYEAVKGFLEVHLDDLHFMGDKETNKSD
ncbi:related to mitochondrial carrier protein [Melanopsichium pennsylvanicum]|uniref:Related to mitochondrial carrier protein n=2 Tax=Melanopsichium pennsylvanicum TaxID=63383 RepID=A0AAJ4XJG6_9BASI|nr:related to mitochondrial carrier protein [Melanopsichium pennsylvanicum 4]SNX83494.1 related to mitochondrial carrier protein [Melanopsichium pennsylvanicum]